MRLSRFSFVYLLLACVAKGQPPSSDPIFGMVYDSKTVHFEQAAAAVITQCETYKPLKNKPFWLFAHASVDGTEFFILSNRTTEDSGAGFIQRGTQCVNWLPESMIAGESALGSKDALPKWAALNDAIVKALSQDAFRRYTQAFGGKKKFLDAVQKGGLKPAELPKVFREELAAFSREP